MFFSRVVCIIIIIIERYFEYFSISILRTLVSFEFPAMNASQAIIKLNIVYLYTIYTDDIRVLGLSI